MSSASTLPYARDALVTKLQARAGLSAVKVSRGLPKVESDVQSDGGAWEAIWVGREGAQDADFGAVQPFLTAAAPRWDEEYTLWATIQVLKPDTASGVDDAEERAWALAYEFIGAVSADLTLGVAISGDVLMFEVRGVEWNDVGRLLDKAGAAHRLEVGLQCFGRLRIT